MRHHHGTGWVHILAGISDALVTGKALPEPGDLQGRQIL
jgi:hypothetical protein